MNFKSGPIFEKESWFLTLRLVFKTKIEHGVGYLTKSINCRNNDCKHFWVTRFAIYEKEKRYEHFAREFPPQGEPTAH